MRTFAIFFFVVINSSYSAYGQLSYYIYPPACKVADLELITIDSTFLRIGCSLFSDSISTLLVRHDLVDVLSIPGWVIIRSGWNDSLVSKPTYQVCLNDKDIGREVITYYHENRTIQGIYERSRPILILNLYDCKILYLENEDLFQLYTESNEMDFYDD